jgi:hypothetical protein
MGSEDNTESTIFSLLPGRSRGRFWRAPPPRPITLDPRAPLTAASSRGEIAVRRASAVEAGRAAGGGGVAEPVCDG